MTATSQRHGGLFYGWWVVGASVMGLALSWPTIAIYTFGPFVIPLSEEFGWPRGQMSVAVAIVTWTAMAMSIVLGLFIDRTGVRRVMIPSIVLLGLTVASMYWLTPALLHFYVMFFLIALLGAGTSVLAFSKLVMNWFDRHRGLALGITMAGVGIGAAVMPIIVTQIIVGLGWRQAYLAMGILVLVVGGGPVALLVRERPREMGLEKDGAAAPVDRKAGARVEQGYLLSEAVRTRPFWFMVVAFFLVGVCAHGSLAHLVPLLQDRGIPPERSAQIASTLGIALIFGRVVAGYMMDRIFAPLVGIVFMAGPVLGLALLALGAVGPAAVLATILLGLAIGAEFDFLGYFTSRYGGLKSFGLLYGLMLASFQLGGGLGPILMGYSFDQLGSYTLVLWVFAGLFVLVCLLFALLGPYPDLPEHPETV